MADSYFGNSVKFGEWTCSIPPADAYIEKHLVDVLDNTVVEIVVDILVDSLNTADFDFVLDSMSYILEMMLIQMQLVDMMKHHMMLVC